MVRLHTVPAFLRTAAIVALLAAALVVNVGASPAPSDPYGVPGIDYVDGRVLVRFAPGTPAAAVARAHADAGARPLATLPAVGVTVVDVGPGRVPAAVRAYQRNPNVLFAEPDLIARATVDCTGETGTFANDPCSWRQWGLENTGQFWGEGTGLPDADVDVPEAWSAGARGAGVVVAVLDTGYDTTHPDLSGRVEAVADFTDTGVEDRHGHGTWTASIAAAAAGNSVGMAGTAPEAHLIVGKVLGDSGSGGWSQVAQGITWAANYGYATGRPTVISMSLGGRCYRGRLFLCNTLQAAVEDAAAKGALLLAAAGNSGKSAPEYPAAFPAVLAVAASDDHDVVASFSNAGDVAAPGVGVFGAFPDCIGQATFALQSRGIDCSYDYGSGTSAATPIVAGVAALVWSAAPGATASDVWSALTGSAQDIPGTAYDGAGRVTACGALVSVGVACTEAPGGGSGGGGGEPSATYELSLTGSSTNEGRTWTAIVTASVSQAEAPATGVDLVGQWSTGASASCTTGSDGSCTVSLAGISKKTGSVTFTVTSVGGGTDFTGTTAMTVTKP